MTRALVVPAADGHPARVVEAHDRRIGMLIGAETIDLVTHRHGGWMIAVDDAGFRKELPVNVRATALAQTIGRAWSSPLVGDVVILGVNEAGVTVNVPAEVQELFIP